VRASKVALALCAALQGDGNAALCGGLLLIQTAVTLFAKKVVTLIWRTSRESRAPTPRVVLYGKGKFALRSRRAEEDTNGQ